MSKVVTVGRMAQSDTPRRVQTVDFPSLAHFVEDARAARLRQLRVDVFSYQQPSALSFITYMSLVLYVTGFDAEHQVLYQYKEVFDTKPSVEADEIDEVAVRRVTKRMEDLARALRNAGFDTAYGRFVVPDP